MEIAALVSGGVDSSVVVHLLKEAGYTPTLFYIRIGMEDKDKTLHCHSEEDIEIVSYMARKYGCRLEVVSLHNEYWEYVMGYTLDAIKRGFTPNPDVMCNKYIKFGFFEQYWGKDFDKIATGHYASIVEENGITYLGTAIDPVKDQTDFLSQLNTLQVSKLMFPLGGLMKTEVRAIAEKAGLPSAKRKDSQGICFLGNINYNEFIRNYLGEREGDIIELETGKKLGKHKGYWFHTIGQRKGLGLSGGPWFVIRKDIKHNRLYVSNGFDPDTQYGTELNLTGFRFITGNPLGDLSEPTRITFKNRHTPEFTGGTLQRTGEDKVRIVSDERIQGIAPGQFGVIYSADRRLCLVTHKKHRRHLRVAGAFYHRAAANATTNSLWTRVRIRGDLNRALFLRMFLLQQYRKEGIYTQKHNDHHLRAVSHQGKRAGHIGIGHAIDGQCRHHGQMPRAETALHGNTHAYAPHHKKRKSRQCPQMSRIGKGKKT